MNFDRDAWIFDCEPTLKDSQVLEFCREGYLLLPGVVPEEINHYRLKPVVWFAAESRRCSG